MTDISIMDEDDNGEAEASNQDSTPDIVEASQPSGIVEPAADASEVKEMYDRFSDMKSEIIGKEDKQKIGNNFFIKKSGWRKIATAFNVSVSVAEKEIKREPIAEGFELIHVIVTAEASAPNGKSVSAMGACSSNESNFLRTLNVDEDASIEEAGKEASKFVPASKVPSDVVVYVDGRWRMIKRDSELSIHDILTTASTRAKNRAISDLVGGGEVSAEEITKDDVL